jgi:hypothetical protein
MSAHLWNLSGTRQTLTTLTRSDPGARAYFFETDTTTPLTVYEDADLSTAHDHPLEADAFGEWPAVYIPAGTFKVRVLSSAGVQLFEFDGVVAPGVPRDSELEVSAYWETVLDDADAATSLATLGFHTWVVTNWIGVASASAARTLLDVQQNGISTVSEKTDTYTLVLTDAGKTIHMNKATANSLVIPPNASVAFTVGTWINIVQTGAGATTIDADTGVTLNGASAGNGLLSGQWSGVSIQKTATNTWVMVGNHGVVS